MLQRSTAVIKIEGINIVDALLCVQVKLGDAAGKIFCFQTLETQQRARYLYIGSRRPSYTQEANSPGDQYVIVNSSDY